MRKEQGITIISLVVTIIILIILAGVSINLLLGQNGIITKAKEAKENMELAKIEEEQQLNELEYYLNNYGEYESSKEESSSMDVSLLVDAFKYSGLGITEENTFEEICEIIKNAYPELPIGTTYNFAYTGDVQEWICEFSGLYQLEVYGAQGGSSGYYSGGAGGNSVGYKYIEKGTKLYIYVGGSGSTGSNSSQVTVGKGGYNGGGNGCSHNYTYGGGGGGATHIATLEGLLSNLSSNKSSVLIVAGGGGGCYNSSSGGNGGSGGGTNGGDGAAKSSWGTLGKGGTQSSGGSGASGTDLDSIIGIDAVGASFGKGGYLQGYSDSSSGNATISGGGGGYFGGGAGFGACGGGGSGYIGGVPEVTYKGKTYSPSSLNGNNNGNGKAIITFVAY